MNPALEIGLRLAAWSIHWNDLEILKDILPYIVGPLVGGPIGAAIAEFIMKLS